MRSLNDVSKALYSKLWWNFKTSTSLWSTYMSNKYCKKQHSLLAESKGASHVWKKMVEVKEEVEHNIWWQIGSGEVSFWFDNWTKQGALYLTENQRGREEEIEVKRFITNERWDGEMLSQVLSEEMVDHITENISPSLLEREDKPWWMGNTCGRFTVKSAF